MSGFVLSSGMICRGLFLVLFFLFSSLRRCDKIKVNRRSTLLPPSKSSRHGPLLFFFRNFFLPAFDSFPIRPSSDVTFPFFQNDQRESFFGFLRQPLLPFLLIGMLFLSSVSPWGEAARAARFPPFPLMPEFSILLQPFGFQC